MGTVTGRPGDSTAMATGLWRGSLDGGGSGGVLDGEEEAPLPTQGDPWLRSQQELPTAGPRALVRRVPCPRPF